MMSYKDKTFCSFYKECEDGLECDRALTDDIKKRAFQGGCYISNFIEHPSCFEPILKNKM